MTKVFNIQSIINDAPIKQSFMSLVLTRHNTPQVQQTKQGSLKRKLNLRYLKVLFQLDEDLNSDYS